MWILVSLSAAASEPSVEAFVACALEHDAELASTASALAAARGTARDARGPFDNPEVQLGGALVGGLVQGSVTQPVSLTGAGLRLREASAAGVERASAVSAGAALVAAAAARRLLADKAASDALVASSDAGLAAASRLRGVVELRRDAGEATDLDVALARLAEADAVALSLADRATLSDLRRDLSIACPTAPPPVGIRVEDPVPAATGPRVDRFDLSAAKATAAEAAAVARLERATAVPPVGVGVFFQRDLAHGDPGDVGPQVVWTMPLWRRNHARTEAADGAVREAAVAQARVVADASAGVFEARRRADDAARLVTGLVSLGDGSEGALQAVERAFTSGELGLAVALQLREQVASGSRAALEARRAAAEAELAALLAEEDAGLLPSSQEEP